MKYVFLTLIALYATVGLATETWLLNGKTSTKAECIKAQLKDPNAKCERRTEMQLDTSTMTIKKKK